MSDTPDIDKADFMACFGHESGARMIAHLKKKFGVNLPVFQKDRKKHDDPLYDALITDGNHEVVQYIEGETDFAFTKQ